MTINQIKAELVRLHDRELDSIPFLKKTQGKSSVMWASGKAQGYHEALQLLQTRRKVEREKK